MDALDIRDMERIARRYKTREKIADAARPIVEAFRKWEDPGTSDLDNEQPYYGPVTLGDIRKLSSLFYELDRS